MRAWGGGVEGSETPLRTMTGHMDGEELSARRAAKCSSWLILFQPHGIPEWTQRKMFLTSRVDRRAVAELGLEGELLARTESSKRASEGRAAPPWPGVPGLWGLRHCLLWQPPHLGSTAGRAAGRQEEGSGTMMG